MRLIVLLLLIVSNSLYAQVTFNHTYGGTNWDFGSSIWPTTDGHYLVAGYTESFTVGFLDMYMLKMDSCGNEVWYNSFGTTGQDYGQALIEASSGRYYAAGGVGAHPIWLLELNPLTGDTLWRKVFTGDLDPNVQGLQETLEGDLLITAARNIAGTPIQVIRLIKTDPNGNLMWVQEYGDTVVNYWAMETALATDSGYVVAGGYYDTTISENQALLIKTDRNGSVLWQKTYGYGVRASFNAIDATNDGGFIMAGSIWYQNIYVVRVNGNGDTLWTKTLDLSFNDVAFGVRQTPDSGFIVVGEGAYYGWGNWDQYAIKLDSAGNTVWMRGYGGAEADYIRDVRLANDGGFVFCGTTKSAGNGQQDVSLIKTDSHGIVLPPPVLNISVVDTTALVTDSTFCAGSTIYLHADSAQSPVTWSTGDTTLTIAITTPGTYTVGYGQGCYAVPDAITLDTVYCDPTGIEQQQQKAAQLFPNPMQAQATIIAPGSEELLLLDLSGGIVAHTRLQNGRGVLYRHQLQRGIYFYRTMGKKQYTGKVMLE